MTPKDVVNDCFVWDADKAQQNLERHGISFEECLSAFLDPQRLITVDSLHSVEEPRLFCIGKIGNRVVTVRFTLREGYTRIIGAGYWRKGRKLYEKAQSHR